MNYYRRFIPNFSEHSQHLTRLTRKNIPFIWSEKCQKAFEYLKKSLLSPEILKYPDYEKQFCITTDASNTSCGAVLSQDYDGIQLPIAFASRTFTKGEKNKSVIEKELTAIHWAINFFKPYVYGTKFLLRTDHKPLVYLFSLKDPTSKLTRMRLDLEIYDFEIQFVKGVDNVAADALSRIDFDQIKSITNESSVKVITRSMSRKNSSKQAQSTPTNDDVTPQPRVFESLNNFELRHIPKLSFYLNDLQCSLKAGKKVYSRFYLDDCLD
jgi:hypothetical protein